MKKLFSFVLGVLLAFSLFAEEKILISSDAKADLDGYDYVSNFEITSASGTYAKNMLHILAPTEKGFRFCATNVPIDRSTRYTIVPAYPSFLNEGKENAGFIDNAAAVKSIKVVGSTNRPYDEISILYKTSIDGVVHKILMPQNFDNIRTMEEFTLEFDNPGYEPDVTKRSIKSNPALGADTGTIQLVGIEVKTNTPPSGYAYSEYSVFYLKSVTFVYDNMFTQEQLDARKAMKEEFGINEGKNAEIKAKASIAEKNRVRENEKALMDKTGETSN